jgi:hypothetical protein
MPLPAAERASQFLRRTDGYNPVMQVLGAEDEYLDTQDLMG